MKIGLVLTNDWELFGDGSGNYFEIQHRPLEDLLSTIENHGAKLTVMAEVGQQWAHQKISKQGLFAHDIVVAWESILRDTIKREFDVQLHLHPQWLHAAYENNQWLLDLNKVALPRLHPQLMEKVLKEGKRYLDSLLQPIDPNYECVVFRAGWYCMQPSGVVTEKLLKAGLACDSSVVGGRHKPGFFDYRNAHSNYLPWFADPENIKCKSDRKGDGLLEIPIASLERTEIPILRKFISQKLHEIICFGTCMNRVDREWFSNGRQKILKRYPLDKRPFQNSILHDRSLMGKINRSLSKMLFAKVSIQLDYDRLSPGMFVKLVQAFYKKASANRLVGKNDIIIPVIAVGHTKSMHNCDNINRILDEINTRLREKVIYWKLSDAFRYWIKVLSSRSE